MTHNHNGTHLLVQVPNDYNRSYGIAFDSSCKHWLRYYPVNRINSHDSRIIKLPPATYGQPFLASEAGEDEAKGVVEKRKGAYNVYKCYVQYDWWHSHATASLASLCRSKGWEPGETIVIPILK